jgi:hypothetical protein
MMIVVRALLLALAGVAVLASAGDQAAAQAPPAPATPAPTPMPDIEDFVPSEKVSADDAVAFPVDI